eukprot:scaffold742_cov395-Prasinococcus_capsulatus_cf.AAC.15
MCHPCGAKRGARGHTQRPGTCALSPLVGAILSGRLASSQETSYVAGCTCTGCGDSWVQEPLRGLHPPPSGSSPSVVPWGRLPEAYLPFSMPKVTKKTILAESLEASENNSHAPILQPLKNKPQTPSFAPASAKELQSVEKSFRKASPPLLAWDPV